MSLTKEEITALLRLIDASQTDYTVVSSKTEYAELESKLRDQLYKLTV